MKFSYKKFLSIISITIIIMTVAMIGFSYAWYASNQKTVAQMKTLGADKLSIDYEESEVISYTIGLPIKDEDAVLYGAKNKWTATINKISTNTTFLVRLVEIDMDSALKNSNFKYQLFRDDISIESGSFSGIGSASEYTLYTNAIPANTDTTTNNYELRIWLSDDDSNQNALMDKTFNAKVQLQIYATIS